MVFLCVILFKLRNSVIPIRQCRAVSQRFSCHTTKEFAICISEHRFPESWMVRMVASATGIGT